MRSSVMDKSWALWLDNATELRRQRRVLSTVTARMRHTCVYAAFASWVDMSKGQRRRRDVLRKIVPMMIHAALFKAWNRWLEHSMQVTRLRQNLRKVAARMQHGELCKSWAIWNGNVATLGRIDTVCKRAHHTYNRRMALSLMFGWRLATKDAMAVCQRKMPFSRTSSFLVRKYERAVCSRAISCWHYCCTARRSLRHAHFIVERVPFVSLSVFLSLSMPPPPLSSCLPSFLCLLYACTHTHTHTHIDTQTNATETASSLQLYAFVFASAPRE
jgi:hypothetical protein